MEKRQKRSMNLANASDSSLPIPIDIIIMIFAKLPLKSIARCRCVSKLWGSILRRSDFTELFLRRSRSSIPKLLFAYPINGELLFYSSLKPQNMDSDSSSLLPSYQMKFSIGSPCQYFNIVHGLFLFEDWKCLNGNAEKVVKICNPSTGQVLILPKLKSNRKSMWNLLGYDPIDKQFKVLAMTLPVKRSRNLLCEEYQVLTLGSGNLSWRMIECCIPHKLPRRKVCINGVLYYIDFHGQIAIRPDHHIACFDVRLEKFYFVKTIKTFNGLVHNGSVDLINYNGKLGLLQLYVGDNESFVFDGRSITVKLWVLEDHEKHEWTEHTFLFSNVPKYIYRRSKFEVVGVTKKNEIVLSSRYSFSTLFYFNLEKKTIVSVEIQGMEKAERRKYYTFLDHVEDVKLY